MRDFDSAEQLRRRGNRLVALALNAHRIGHSAIADQITERAAQLLDEATLREAAPTPAVIRDYMKEPCAASAKDKGYRFLINGSQTGATPTSAAMTTLAPSPEA